MDQIEALEALHNAGDEDLHFRFIGTAKGRQFVVNVQFGSTHNEMGEKLSPVEYDFMIGGVLALILGRLGEVPNPVLH